MRRRLSIGVAATAVFGAVTVALLTMGSGRAKPNAKLPPATVEVVKMTLVDTKTVPGTLGYGDPVPVSATGRGTITWIAPAGWTVARGQPLFKLDERPVVVLYGTLSLYRPLQVGAAGADVRQLEENLAALGYVGLRVDDTYTTTTAAVVRKWQGDLGLPTSGEVAPGQAVFTGGPVRIAQDIARVGDPVSGDPRPDGAVLTYTGTARLVTVDLAVADRPLAVQGRTVTVTVPGAGTVEGTIATIGTIATPKPQEGATPGSTASPASDARVQVTVAIADQAALGSLDAAPVDVNLASGERNDVLAVPVAALLALPDGGFGVEAVDGATTHIVPVKTGLFAAGRVEISGDRIAEGMTVGVAK
jgi:peptidoglycan hydrolase-like protein with peptidoglycan-binding domain